MKKMKIFMSILLTVVLALASFSAVAVYEEQIIFSDVVYYGEDGASIIDGPQNGTFYAEATASYDGSAERSAMMMGALYDSATGEIKSIAVSDTQVTWPGDTAQKLNVKLENVENIDSYEFKCFMIDDLMRHTPLDNGAPATPSAVVADAVTKNSADISWIAALDDFDGVESYNVYKNGAYAGTTDTLGFTVENLLRNSTNVFSVRANDGEFLSEEAVSEPVQTEIVPEHIFDFSGNTFVHGQKHIVDGNGLAPIMTNGGSHSFKTSEEVAGRMCAVITGSFPGFAPADPEYITVDDNNVVFELTYLDATTDSQPSSVLYVNAQTTANDTLSAVPKIKNPNYHPVYNNTVAEEIQENLAAPKITNTGVWKTVVMEFTDVAFTATGADKQLGKCFYVRSAHPQTVPLYLASGNLYLPEDYVPMNPNMVVAYGGQTVYAMEFTLAGGYDVAYTIQNMDGVDCVASTDAGNLSYKVTDLDVKNAETAILEVGFYDDNEGDTLHVGSQEIELDGSGWRTVALEIPGSELAAGFEIYKESNTIVYLKDLQSYVK